MTERRLVYSGSAGSGAFCGWTVAYLVPIIEEGKGSRDKRVATNWDLTVTWMGITMWGRLFATITQ